MTTNFPDLREKVTNLVNASAGKLPHGVSVGVNPLGRQPYLKIWIACSTHEINRVQGQLPQVVSLHLSHELELSHQVFGGNGGRWIYRRPNMDSPREKYLAMASEKVPFRTPEKNEDAVLRAIGRFINNYKRILIENKAELMYQDIVDYDSLLA